MILKVQPTRDADGALSIVFDGPTIVSGVHGLGIASIDYQDADGETISAQRGGRCFPIAHGVRRLAIRESAPGAVCGFLTVATLEPRTSNTGTPVMCAPWLE